jgi:hypothetical protein
VYLSALRSLHLDLGLDAEHCNSPTLQRLIRGIRRYHGEPGRLERRPITTAILHKLLQHVAVDDLVSRASFTLAFAGFLRSGEFTVNGAFDPALHLSRGSITFHPDMESATHLSFSLPASKTDPFRRGVVIHVAAAPGQPSCPVAAMRALFLGHPLPASAPLFQLPNGTLLTKKASVELVRRTLLAAGEDGSRYHGHSWRRGAATSAMAAGFNEAEIQLLGRWKSDAWKLYADVDPSRLLRLNSLLHWVQPSSSTPFAPPVQRDEQSLA